MPRLKVGTVFPSDAEDARIRAGIAVDPDTYEVTSAEDWARMRPMGRPKVASPKASGDGWQTRMDAVLREYVSQHKAA